MRRREFVASIGSAAAAWPLTARSQPARAYRIGILGSEDSPPWEGLRQGLRDLGYIDGRNVTIEWRWAEGRPDRYPSLAIELVQQRVDVIVASATQAMLAAKQATTTIPIVMTQSFYPEKLGLVESLARPGGNVTGLTNFSQELIGKRLELLKDLAPTIARVAVIWNPTSPVESFGFQDVSAAATVVGIKIESVDVRNPEELSTALPSLRSNRPDALYPFGNPINVKSRKLIVDTAAQNQLPSIYEQRLFVVAGGLMSYAPSFTDMFRRAATYVDRILKGAQPADLPIERPTKFELVINMMTAKALGLTVPPSLLARADEVIE
jgi:putative tryptophan/tyrosine transport system substrate-binding protein